LNWNFSAWAIRNPVPPIVLFVVLCFLGLVSFSKLPVTRFPSVDVPVISITVTQAGAAPAELESQVTKIIEDAVAGITGVKHILSTLTDGSSVTAIEFRLEINQDRALNDVKDAVAKVRANLPRTIDEPIIERIDVEGQSIQTYAIAAPAMTLEQLSWYVDDTVKRALQGLKGVGRVERYGGADREIRIELDPDRMMALNVTPAEISRQLKSTNTDLGGGRSEIGGQEQAIRTLAGVRTVHELGEMRLWMGANKDVRLKDLGKVTDGSTEPRTFARLDGEPIVALAVFRAKGQSDVDVARVVSAKLAELSKLRPDISFTIIDDAVRYTVGNYDSAMKTLVEGSLLAVLVVFLFLRNWRATLISAIALPLSAIPTFWAIDALGFSLNLVSLLGITLATGILVDDAIVEIENIVRHMRMGKSPFKAALEAADEIGLAVIAISLTIVAVFAPVSFMGGIAGQYFKQFGLTVAISVLFSLLVARLVTPLLAAYFLRPIAHRQARDGFIMRGYTRFLEATLRHRYLTLLIGIGIFAASIWATGLLPTGFVPAGDESRITMSIELPPGSTLEDTRRKTDAIKDAVKKLEGVERVFTLGGTTPTGAGREIRKAAMIVRLFPKSQRKVSQKQIEGRITAAVAAIADVRMWYVNPRGEREITMNLLATPEAPLDEVVARVEGALRRVPGFTNVASTGALDRPEVRISPRYDVAGELGITPEMISDTIRIATIGDVGPQLAKFNAGDRLVPIRVQLVESARAKLNILESVRLTGANGKSVPLTAVADVSFTEGPSSLERFDRQRRAAIGADLVGGLQLGPAVTAFRALPEVRNLPPGVRVAETGEAEIMAEVFQGFAFAMATGILIVLAVLLILFGSVFQPGTILLSLPLSVGGVVAGLLIAQKAISMPVVIGILMLMGIVTKNAIMLVDFAIEEMKKGVHRFEAIVDAGRKRARPIVMTTIAMVAGMVPAANGVGDGGEFRSPMAIAVIGGLLVSTVLSLVFVPSFFTIMDDLGNLMGRIFGRFIGPGEDAEAAPADASPVPIAPAPTAASAAELAARLADPQRPRLAAE
jgi:hydrophobe/amphiphile efflux-1 (HAE1) family protein